MFAIYQPSVSSFTFGRCDCVTNQTVTQRIRLASIRISLTNFFRYKSFTRKRRRNPSFLQFISTSNQLNNRVLLGQWGFKMRSCIFLPDMHALSASDESEMKKQKQRTKETKFSCTHWSDQAPGNTSNLFLSTSWRTIEESLTVCHPSIICTPKLLVKEQALESEGFMLIIYESEHNSPNCFVLSQPDSFDLPKKVMLVISSLSCFQFVNESTRSMRLVDSSKQLFPGGVSTDQIVVFRRKMLQVWIMS